MKNYSDEWKKKVHFRQIDYEDFVMIEPVNGVFLQKLDGMLGTYIYRKGKPSFFQTTSGNEIFGIPVQEEYDDYLRNKSIDSIIIPGELVAKKGGKIQSFNDTQSIVKRFREEANKSLIYHYPVDIFYLNGKTVNFTQAEKLLDKISKNKKHIELPKIVHGGLENFRNLYRETIKPGYDGVVARDVNGRNYKVKFVSTVDLVVIGAGNTGMPSWPRKQISYLLTAFIDKNGVFRTSSKVGTGFTNANRSYFYDNIVKNKISERNGEMFVKPDIMIEIRYFRSRITDTPSLIYMGNDYLKAKDEKSITFSHPSFLRLRLDKPPNKLNSRLEQIPEWIY